NPERLLAVVSPPMEGLPAILGMEGEFETVVQDPPSGTADAVRTALGAVSDVDYIVSLLGDNPLLTTDVVQSLMTGAMTPGRKVTILSCLLPHAESYGRIHRVDDRVTSIIEAKNDDPVARKGETEINSGIMVLEAAWARDAL